MRAARRRRKAEVDGIGGRVGCVMGESKGGAGGEVEDGAEDCVSFERKMFDKGESRSNGTNQSRYGVWRNGEERRARG